MEVTTIKISEIKMYQKNAKKHPQEQIAIIANSIKEFGWRQPLVIDSNGEIIVGHGRYLAAQQLGMKEVPCILADDLTPEHIKAYRLADNKTNESDWIFDMLMPELDELSGKFDFDMSNYGFEFGNITIPEYPSDDDDEPKVQGMLRCPACDYTNEKKAFVGRDG